MRILQTALDRIRTSTLAPEHFIKGFGALLVAVNHTGDPAVAINIDYTDEDEVIGPDELIPVITLSFRTRETHEETKQANAQEPQDVQVEVCFTYEDAPQDDAQVAQDPAQDFGRSLPG